jgi:hypothetical protein
VRGHHLQLFCATCSRQVRTTVPRPLLPSFPRPRPRRWWCWHLRSAEAGRWAGTWLQSTAGGDALSRARGAACCEQRLRPPIQQVHASDRARHVASHPWRLSGYCCWPSLRPPLAHPLLGTPGMRQGRVDAVVQSTDKVSPKAPTRSAAYGGGLPQARPVRTFSSRWAAPSSAASQANSLKP